MVGLVTLIPMTFTLTDLQNQRLSHSRSLKTCNLQEIEIIDSLLMKGLNNYKANALSLPYSPPLASKILAPSERHPISMKVETIRFSISRLKRKTWMTTNLITPETLSLESFLRMKTLIVLKNQDLTSLTKITQTLLYKGMKVLIPIN